MLLAASSLTTSTSSSSSKDPTFISTGKHGRAFFGEAPSDPLSQRTRAPTTEYGDAAAPRFLDVAIASHAAQVLPPPISHKLLNRLLLFLVPYHHDCDAYMHPPTTAGLPVRPPHARAQGRPGPGGRGRRRGRAVPRVARPGSGSSRGGGGPGVSVCTYVRIGWAACRDGIWLVACLTHPIIIAYVHDDRYLHDAFCPSPAPLPPGPFQLLGLHEVSQFTCCHVCK